MGRASDGMKCIEIRSLLKKGAYEDAMKVADTIDILRVKSIVDLKLIASVYEQMGEYAVAKDILLLSYEKKQSKMTIYRLAYLSIKTKEFDDAEKYYDEFSELAPDSPDRYILRYGIDRAKNVDYVLRIATLQKLKQIEYTEEWGYELAKIYHKAGLYEECIRECQDLIIWFHDGLIVDKAKLLCKYHEEGKQALDAYGVLDKNLSPEEIEQNREQFFNDTRDLNDVKAAMKERQLQQMINLDMEHTVDLRQVLKEDGADLDLLTQEVHRVWGKKTEQSTFQKSWQDVEQPAMEPIQKTPIRQAETEALLAASVAEVMEKEDTNPNGESEMQNSGLENTIPYHFEQEYTEYPEQDEFTGQGYAEYPEQDGFSGQGYAEYPEQDKFTGQGYAEYPEQDGFSEQNLQEQEENAWYGVAPEMHEISPESSYVESLDKQAYESNTDIGEAETESSTEETLAETENVMLTEKMVEEPKEVHFEEEQQEGFEENPEVEKIEEEAVVEPEIEEPEEKPEEPIEKETVEQEKTEKPEGKQSRRERRKAKRAAQREKRKKATMSKMQKKEEQKVASEVAIEGKQELKSQESLKEELREGVEPEEFAIDESEALEETVAEEMKEPRAEKDFEEEPKEETKPEEFVADESEALEETVEKEREESEAEENFEEEPKEETRPEEFVADESEALEETVEKEMEESEAEESFKEESKEEAKPEETAKEENKPQKAVARKEKKTSTETKQTEKKKKNTTDGKTVPANKEMAILNRLLGRFGGQKKKAAKQVEAEQLDEMETQDTVESLPVDETKESKNTEDTVEKNVTIPIEEETEKIGVTDEKTEKNVMEEEKVELEEIEEEASTDTLEEMEEEESFTDRYGILLWEYFQDYQVDTRLCEDVYTVLEKAKEKESAGNYIVTCKNKERALGLARNLAKALETLELTQTHRVAKINAEKLNRMHLEKNYDKIKGGCLFVEDAKKMTADTAQSIMNAINELQDDLVVILSDARPYLKDLLEEYPMMRRYFPYDLSMK